MNVEDVIAAALRVVAPRARSGGLEIVNSEWDDGEDEADVHRIEVGKGFGG